MRGRTFSLPIRAMRDQNRIQTALVALVLAFNAAEAHAYLPIYLPPHIVAEQADLILVGRIKEGSVEYLPVKGEWEKKEVTWFLPHARMIVTEVAHGELTDKEIVIWFGGGAVPVVGGRFEWDYGGKLRKLRISRQTKSKNTIEIYEINNSWYNMYRGHDFRKDHVWFLQSHSGLPGLKAGERGWCMDDSRYVAPVEEKDYYLAYLAKDTKTALLAQAEKRPDRAGEIRAFLESLDDVKNRDEVPPKPPVR